MLNGRPPYAKDRFELKVDGHKHHTCRLTLYAREKSSAFEKEEKAFGELSDPSPEYEIDFGFFFGMKLAEILVLFECFYEVIG